MNRRRIIDLQPGESVFTPTHAAWVSGQDMYLNGNYPIRSSGLGSFGLRLVKFPNGRLAVDLTGCTGERFHGVAAFAGKFVRVHVDEALVPPLPSVKRRVFDMAPGEEAYIHPRDAWLWNGRMWIDGSTLVFSELSEQTPLRIMYESDKSWAVDTHYCQTALYPPAPLTVSKWPIQIHRHVKQQRWAA